MKKFSLRSHAIWKYFSLSIQLLMVIAMVGCQPGDRTATDEPVPTVTANQVTRKPSPTKTIQTLITNTPQVPEGLQIDPEALADMSILFVHPFAGDAEETLGEIVRSFSLTNPWGIWVDAAAFPSEQLLIESLTEAVEEGSPPDLVALHLYENLAWEGVYESIDLQPYYHDPNWGFSQEEQEDIPNVYLEPFTSGESMLALPFAPKPMVMFYNQTWAEELGFSAPPTDEEEFRQQSLEATLVNLEDYNDDNDGTGGYLIRYEPESFASWFLAFGGELPLHSTPEFDLPAGRDAFGYLKSVYDEGYFWLGRQPEPYPYFANRYTLMYAGRLDEVADQTGWMATIGNADSWRLIGFPGPQGETMLVDSTGLMVTKGSPEAQMAAWLFAKHLLEPEVQAQLVRAMFSLPVRDSAVLYLGEFMAQYPQWAQALDLVEVAQPAPSSSGWGIAKWVLQDAAYRVFPGKAEDVPMILEQLDEMVSEFEGMVP